MRNVTTLGARLFNYVIVSINSRIALINILTTDARNNFIKREISGSADMIAFVDHYWASPTDNIPLPHNPIIDAMLEVVPSVVCPKCGCGLFGSN
jgi:hypothetical protein